MPFIIGLAGLASRRRSQLSSNVRPHSTSRVSLPMKSTTRRLLPRHALLLGVALVVAALALAEFLTFPEVGHRIDTTRWPIAAQAILKETPGTPITSEQWKRIDKVLKEHGDMNYGQRAYWSSTVSASWWWFLAVPLLAVAVLRFSGWRLAPLSLSLLAVPSVIILVAGVALAGPAA